MLTRFAIAGILFAAILTSCHEKPPIVPDEKAAAIASLRQQIASAEAELADVEKSIGITVTNILQTMKPVQ